MDETRLSRRRLLQSSGLAVVGGLAGCLAEDESDPETPTGTDVNFATSPLEFVPEGATAVGRVDVASLLSATEMRSAMNDLMAGTSASDSPVTVESALDTIEEASGLDPRKVTELIGFGRLEADSYAGGYLRTDWTDGELLAKANTTEWSTRTYDGQTIHEQDGGAVVVLGDGDYVFGTSAAVEDALDVRSGGLAPVDGNVERAYRSAREGPIRVAFDVPESLVDSDGTADRFAEDIDYGYHSLYPTGGGLGFVVALEATGAEAASDIADQIEGTLVVVGQQADSVEDPEMRDIATLLAEQTEVTREGTSVTVRNTAGGGELFGVAVAAFVTSSLFGLGERTEPVSPTVSFEFDYDSTGEVTIIHDGGDHVRADRLFVRGELLEATGSWLELGGEASSDIGGEPAVTAGDSLTVGAQANSRVDILWKDSESSSSAVLAEFEGPEA